MQHLLPNNQYLQLNNDVQSKDKIASPVKSSITANNSHPKNNIALLEPQIITKKPPMFRVIMLNDDYTPMDFVVDVLKNIFKMTHEDAISKMLQIHHHGAADCGVFTRDVAETKIEIAINFAKQHDYPLKCTFEQA